MNNNPLILHLKYKYYDMYINGEKDTDYREYKPYWKKRIKNQKKAILVPGYTLDNSMDIPIDIDGISIISFKELPHHAKLLFANSKWKYFFAIKFKSKEVIKNGNSR